jgi:hypothetical protein
MKNHGGEMLTAPRRVNRQHVARAGPD